tara:strand:+ start:1978 stop:2217 length:240 start_codon:yes stop_codon:yes gene_type:complete
MIILVSTSVPINLVFATHDTEDISLCELGEDFVSEESIYADWFLVDFLAMNNQKINQFSGKIKPQFKDVETPPPEFSFC